MEEDIQALPAMAELPERWASDISDDGFCAAVVKRIARRRRQRAAAIALAGSIGGTIAGAQFLMVANSEPLAAVAAYALTPLQGLVTPNTLLALLMAAVAGSVAWVLPNRV